MKTETVTTRNKREAAIWEIAQKDLHLATLNTRNSDHYDFHNLSVWQIKAALEAAYEAGRTSAKFRHVQTKPTANVPPSVA